MDTPNGAVRIRPEMSVTPGAVRISSRPLAVSANRMPHGSSDTSAVSGAGHDPDQPAVNGHLGLVGQIRVRQRQNSGGTAARGWIAAQAYPYDSFTGRRDLRGEQVPRGGVGLEPGAVVLQRGEFGVGDLLGAGFATLAAGQFRRVGAEVLVCHERRSERHIRRLYPLIAPISMPLAKCRWTNG